MPPWRADGAARRGRRGPDRRRITGHVHQRAEQGRHAHLGERRGDGRLVVVEGVPPQRRPRVVTMAVSLPQRRRRSSAGTVCRTPTRQASSRQASRRPGHRDPALRSGRRRTMMSRTTPEGDHDTILRPPRVVRRLGAAPVVVVPVRGVRLVRHGVAGRRGDRDSNAGGAAHGHCSADAAGRALAHRGALADARTPAHRSGHADAVPTPDPCRDPDARTAGATRPTRRPLGEPAPRSVGRARIPDRCLERIGTLGPGALPCSDRRRASRRRGEARRVQWWVGCGLGPSRRPRPKRRRQLLRRLWPLGVRRRRHPQRHGARRSP